MGRNALDGERPGYAHFFVVAVGLVVQEFVVGFAGNRGIDVTLALDARLPPLRVDVAGRIAPLRLGFAGDLPFFPRLGSSGVECGA